MTWGLNFIPAHLQREGASVLGDHEVAEIDKEGQRGVEHQGWHKPCRESQPVEPQKRLSDGTADLLHECGVRKSEKRV